MGGGGAHPGKIFAIPKKSANHTPNCIVIIGVHCAVTSAKIGQYVLNA